MATMSETTIPGRGLPDLREATLADLLADPSSAAEFRTAITGTTRAAPERSEAFQSSIGGDDGFALAAFNSEIGDGECFGPSTSTS
jgi:hypothetical protein